MKKLALLLFALLAAAGASAQTDARNQMEHALPDRYSKEPSKFIFGVSYRFSLGLVQHAAVKIDGRSKILANGVPDNMKGGALLVSLGANIAKNWSAVAEAGIAMYAGGDYGQLSVKGHYFYGQKPNRWFNYVSAGALVGADLAFLGGVGGGYRIKLGRRPCVDFSVGYELIRATSNYLSEDSKIVAARHGLVFGVGFVF